MKRLFVFVGDGGSGKTTIISELTRQYPEKFRKVVTCTSRSMRTGEVDGEDYHFLPVSYFRDNPNLVLVKRNGNGNYYGTRKEDLQVTTHHSLLTLRFSGIKKLENLGLSHVAVVRILISEALKIERMRQRGDTEEMITHRLVFDATDKANVDYGNFPIIDLYATQSLEENIERILLAC